jgi:hypothetical protein
MSLPIGTIAENLNFSYGYDGKKYYVTEGAFQYLVTRIHLTFDEAKQLFEALTFNNVEDICTKKVSNVIKSARKSKFEGDNLFWHFVKSLK